MSCGVPGGDSPGTPQCEEVVTLQIERTGEQSGELSARVSENGNFLRTARSEASLINYLETVITNRLARHFTNNVLIHCGVVGRTHMKQLVQPDENQAMHIKVFFA